MRSVCLIMNAASMLNAESITHHEDLGQRAKFRTNIAKQTVYKHD